MATLDMEKLLHKRAMCFTVFGEAHNGLLQAVDNNFNTVLLMGHGAGVDQAAKEEGELCFVRGESVMYVGFDDDAAGASGGSSES
ncbi:hypothetical protein ERJ75_000254900 [Trypanosoma vivax]|uniref:U6 snrna-associated sm-like protein n=1 Tax=Trypanosoma vivax (strain Y486) TaxID=1055687 RepID=G0U1Y7_TRYVY|nr:hypothetical protein ERJ75_000254900 [Trypanosoma vivax]CCC50288.1 u6 snrna-associated sm-like protein [Trypanosoma vivax Y486]